MRRIFFALLLALLLALSLAACQQSGTSSDSSEDPPPQSTPSDPAPTKEPDASCSFADLKGLQFSFSSGAGGWYTTLTIQEDGSFSGEYYDGDMGDSGTSYPNGTIYQCSFSGRLAQPEPVNDYTYSLAVQDLTFQQSPDTEEIRDGIRYLYTDATGVSGTDALLLYLPGAPLADLPEEYRSWVGYSDLSATTETTLPFYGLYNPTEQDGFSSYSLLDSLKEQTAAAEQTAASLAASLQKDDLTQQEMNATAAALYDTWDTLLNSVWDVLKDTLDADSMAALTQEEKTWIAEKEAAAKDAGAVYAGGSMEPMAVNEKAAEMTRDRVYELLNLLK